MTTSNWNVSTSGDWSDSSDWSSGIPDGPNDDAVIALSGTYTVSIAAGENFEIGSVTLNDADATLELNGGALNLWDTLTVTAGKLLLKDGGIAGGTIDVAGGTLISEGGGFNAVTVEGTINLNTTDISPEYVSMAIFNGLTMEGADGSGAGTIKFSNYDQYLSIGYNTEAETISGATFELDLVTNANSQILVNTSGVTTFSSSTTLEQFNASTRAELQTNPGFYGETSVVNDGTIEAGSKGGHFDISLYAFTNGGTISVSDGDTLNITATDFSNTGTMNVDGTSALSIDAEVPTAELGTLDVAPGGVVDFAGTLDNTGATFVVPTGAVIVGTIDGGTVEGTIVTGQYSPSSGEGILLTFAGDVAMKGADGSGRGVIDSANDTVLYFDGDSTLSNAILNLGNSTTGGGITNDKGTVTLASSVEINVTEGFGILGESAGTTAGSIISDGTITVAGNQLVIGAATFTNHGAISLSDGATISAANFNVEGNYFDNTGSISVEGASSINISASFDNTGSISIDATSSIGFGTSLTTAELGNVSTVPGGTIVFAGGLDNEGAVFDVPNGADLKGSIEGGTIQGTLVVTPQDSSFTLAGNVAMVGAGGSGNGSIDVSGNDTILFLSGGGSLNDATVDVGSVGAGGDALVNETSVNGATFTLDDATVVELTVAGTTGFLGTDAGISGANSSGTLINYGTIISDANGGTLNIDPATFTNNGIIDAANGGKIVLGLPTNLSSTTLTGGSYEVGTNSTFEFVDANTITTDDATIVLNGASSTMEMLNPETSATITIDSTLTAVESGGSLEIMGGRNWSSSGAFTNAGTIELGGGMFSVSSLSNSGTLSGYGTFETAVSNSGSFALIASGGTLNFSGSFSDLSGPTLANGITLGAEANSTLQLPNGLTFTATDGTVIFGGPGAVIQSLNGSNEVSLMSTLVSIETTGALEVVGDGNFTSSNAIVNAGTIQLGGGTFSAGTLTNSSGATLEGFGTVAAVVDDSGTTTSSGGTLAFTASGNVFAGVIGGTEVEFNGGSDSLQSGVSLTVATVAINGSASLTLGSSQSFTGTFDLSASSITLGANTLTLSGSGSTIDGTISGTGTLALKGGSQTVGSGAVLSVSSIGITSGDAVTIAANTTYAGSLSAATGTTLMVNSGDTLTLSGTTTLNGAIGGSGTLSLGGGTLFVDSGAALNTNELVLGGTATLGLKESLTFAGVVSEGTGTSIAVGTGLTLTLTGTGSTLDGTITGKGTLLLDGGTDTLKGTTMQVSDWTLSDGATAIFGTDITYGGVLTEEAGTTLSLGSKALNMTGGSSDFAGAITGTAALNLEGGSQEFDAGATISTAHWNLTGKDATTIDEDLTYAGAFSSGNGTKIAISAGDTLDLTGAATISSKVSGAGTLELSGGTDVLGRGVGVTIGTLELVDNASVSVDAVIKDTGALSIDATSSLAIDSHKAFDLTAAATGSGTFVIDANATLEFSSTVASTLTANFDGADAILKLADISGFAATISGFVVGDTIDLMHHGANSAVLDGNELVVKHNATVVATLQLSGDYTGYTFTTSSDDHGGTDITLVAPPDGNSGLHIVANTFSPDWHLG